MDEPGKPGWSNHPALAPAEDELVVQKFHPDAFQGTNLHEELQADRVQQLFITGIQTQYCVDTTCRRAYGLGYEVILVEDSHTTRDTRVLKAADVIAYHNEVLGNWFAKPKKASELNFDGAS